MAVGFGSNRTRDAPNFEFFSKSRPINQADKMHLKFSQFRVPQPRLSIFISMRDFVLLLIFIKKKTKKHFLRGQYGLHYGCVTDQWPSYNKMCSNILIYRQV